MKKVDSPTTPAPHSLLSLPPRRARKVDGPTKQVSDNTQLLQTIRNSLPQRSPLKLDLPDKVA
jgi:hypothetical protein